MKYTVKLRTWNGMKPIVYTRDITKALAVEKFLKDTYGNDRVTIDVNSQSA